MLSICICDDEPVLRRELRDMLQHYMQQREVTIIEFHSTQELIQSTASYDVLFLDIRFGDEDAGIEAAKQLRRKGCKAIIVFLTSLSQYATNGYEAEAFRYLVKPITWDMLIETMNAVLMKIESQHFRFSVVAASGTVILEAEDVSHIESVARRRVIHMSKGTIETWETMDELFSKLPKGKFVYLQKGFVSNLANVRQVKNSVITLKHGEEIALSRNYKQDFLLAFNRYVGDGR